VWERKRVTLRTAGLVRRRQHPEQISLDEVLNHASEEVDACFVFIIEGDWVGLRAAFAQEDNPRTAALSEHVRAL
jgi:hypothetical protein